MRIICINIMLMQRRNTKHKERILDLFKKHHILSASDIGIHLPDIDQSTIYRNLDRFQTDGLIKSIDLGLDSARYELADYDHFHFVCVNCDQIDMIDLQAHQLAKLVATNRVITKINFHVEGLCESCQH